MGLLNNFKQGIQAGGKAELSVMGKQAAKNAGKMGMFGSMAHGMGHSIGRFKTNPFGSFKRGAKAGLITGAVVAGVAALGILANRARSGARKHGNEELANTDLESPPVPAMPVMQPEPADGRAQGEWQQRVLAQRGMAMGQPQGPAQPNQNVMPDVQDLGAPQTR